MDRSPRRARGGYADAVVSAVVLFDLDGTLIDRRAAVVAWRTSLEYSRSIHSVELPNLEHRWFSLERSHMDVFLAGECTFVEQRRRRLREFLPELGIAAASDSELDAWLGGPVSRTPAMILTPRHGRRRKDGGA
jgi:FMN phosphatase YigB (HAD superfamily)